MWFKYNLGQKYYVPQGECSDGDMSNAMVVAHNITFCFHMQVNAIFLDSCPDYLRCQTYVNSTDEATLGSNKEI